MTDDRIADAATIAAIREGDRQRYRELVERYKNQVFAVAWCRLGDHSLAEDAAQEAFIKGFQRLHLLSQTEKFGSWIVAIARNAAINLGLHHRNELKKRRRWMLERPADEVRRDDDPEGQPTAETVREALAELPPIHRECLVLFYLEGKSGAEAAAILGLSESAFKTRLHRARGAMRSLLELRVEASMARLRPSDRLAGAVMFAVATQKPAWPVLGAVGAAVVKVLPFSVVVAATQLVGMISGLLLQVWLGRAEQANFRDPHGFRVGNQRCTQRWILVAIAGSTAFGLAVFCLGRKFLLVRTRYTAGLIISNVWLCAASVVVGFLGWDIAWLLAGLALASFTLSFVVAQQPARMDYSLFQRAANGLLKEHDPAQEAPVPAATTADERFRFARFLGERSLVIDWRTRPDALRLRVAGLTPELREPTVPGFWRGSSTLVLKHDRQVLARLGKADRLELLGRAGATATDADRLETTVARSVRQAWAAYARGETARAEAALGEEAATAIFLKDPAKAAAARMNVWAMRLGGVVLATQAIFLTGEFQQPQRLHGRELPRLEVRTRLNAVVAQAAATADEVETLDELWRRSLVLPSRAWFTPETLTAIDKHFFGGLTAPYLFQRGRAIPRTLVPPALLEDVRPEVLALLPKPDPPDPNRAALYYTLLHKAMVWDLIRMEDLARFGVSRAGLRHALSRLTDEERRDLMILERRELIDPAKQEPGWTYAPDLPQIFFRLQFFERMDCLDLVDLTPTVATLRTLQVGPAHPLIERPRLAALPPVDGLFALGIGYDALADTYQALTALRIAGALDEIDREACIQGILRLHQNRSRTSKVISYTSDAKNTYCSYESLRILKAQDRVADWPAWPRELGAEEPMPPKGAPHWMTLPREEETLEACLGRREFERKIAGGNVEPARRAVSNGPVADP